MAGRVLLEVLGEGDRAGKGVEGGTGMREGGVRRGTERSIGEGRGEEIGRTTLVNLYHKKA